MKCGIYIRKSREDKDKPSHRLTVQREQLPANARAQGWQYEIYDDGHASAARGKVENLEERSRLESDIRAGKINIILTIELSRLSRDDSLQDYVAWLHLCSEHRVRLATPSRILDPFQHSDWMLLLMEGGFSSVEMRVLKSRMQDGYNQAFRAGKWLTGPPPPPYIYDKQQSKPVIDQKLLKRMKKVWEACETMSAKKVAEKLGLAYISVRRAISDDRLMMYQAKRIDPTTGETIMCEWEPCMDAEQAERIKGKRRDGFKGYARRHAAGLLSNLDILECGYCGRSVRAWKNGRARKDGSRLDYYGCKANETRRLCERSRMVPQPVLNEKIVLNLFGMLEHLEELQAAWELSQQSGPKADDLREAERKVELLQEQKKRLVAAIAEGIIDFADAKSKRAEIESDIEATRKEISRLQASSQCAPDWEAMTITREEFDSLDSDDQREIVALAIANIKVYSSYLMVEYRFPKPDGETVARINIPPAKSGPMVRREPKYLK